MSAPRSASTPGARSDVMSSCSAVPPMRLAISVRSAPWAGTSTQITCAPSRASTSAIAAPMPREAPVTAAALARQRPVPVGGTLAQRARFPCGYSPGGRNPLFGGVRRGVADADHLSRHVGRAAGQQEAQRRLEVGLRRRVDEVGGRAVADLLAERAHEALERALGGARVAVLPITIARPGRREVAHHGLEEVVDVAQVARGAHARRVEDQGRVRRGPAQRQPDPGDHVAHGARPPPDEHRAVEERGPATELGGLREPEPADHEPPRRGLGELLVSISQCCAPVTGFAPTRVSPPRAKPARESGPLGPAFPIPG